MDGQRTNESEMVMNDIGRGEASEVRPQRCLLIVVVSNPAFVVIPSIIRVSVLCPIAFHTAKPGEASQPILPRGQQAGEHSHLLSDNGHPAVNADPSKAQRCNWARRGKAARLVRGRVQQEERLPDAHAGGLKGEAQPCTRVPARKLARTCAYLCARSCSKHD